MKAIFNNTLLLIIAWALFSVNSLGQNIKLRVVDETGGPVEGAKADISYVLGSSSDIHSGLTDREGFFSAQGKAIVGIYLAASKEGYYPARVDSSRSDRLPSGVDFEKTLVLPRVIDPIALYALDTRSGSSGQSAHFPVQNEWLGFDFQIGDWVQPYGKGKTSDILFRFQNTFAGWKVSEQDMANNRRINKGSSEEELRFVYGKWDAKLDISFPNSKEGMYEETDRFLSYSKLKMPHIAPADGYMPTWHYTAKSYADATTRINVGFFLRTRVKLDEKGNIVSANYTKTVEDIRLIATGYVMFEFYFNPTPNDRNLEFDPKRNLFPSSYPGANVSDP